MADVFISYCHQDADVVARLARGLEDRGYSIWRYEEKSRLGGSYLARIDKEIEACRAALFVISEASLASPQCASELFRAHELGKPLLPFRRGLSHAELMERSREWRMALKGAVTAEVSPETAAGMVDETAAVLDEQGIRPDDPPALTPPNRHRPAGAVRTAISRPAARPQAGAVAAIVVGVLGIPYCLSNLKLLFAPPPGSPSEWMMGTFPVLHAASLLVNFAGVAQNVLLVAIGWSTRRGDGSGVARLRKVALSIIATAGAWLFIGIGSVAGSKNAMLENPAARSGLIGGLALTSLFAFVPAGLLLWLLRGERERS